MAERESPVEKVTNKRGCVFCSSQRLYSLLKVDRVPISSQVLYRIQSDAVSCPTKSLDILLCEECGLVFNGDYLMSQEEGNPYSDLDYFSSVSFSPQSQDYQKQSVLAINTLWGLRGKNVCEIGCGDGFFLNGISEYCDQAIGFEPSPTFHLAKKYRMIRVDNACFDPQRFLTSQRAKIHLFILRHVLEHLSSPFQFLESLMRCYQVQPEDQGLYLEVPDAGYLMENNLYFDFYYDHVYYFTPAFLFNFLKQLGWKNIAFLEGGPQEFIRLFCSNKDLDGNTNKSRVAEMPSYGQRGVIFAQNYHAWKTSMTEQLDALIDRRKKIGVWGAGSRGVTMLISIGGKPDSFRYVVDSDVNKWERFIPILGTPIVSEEMLNKDPIDYLLITSYTYFGEIIKSLTNHTASGLKVIKPYPHVEVV